MEPMLLRPLTGRPSGRAQPAAAQRLQARPRLTWTSGLLGGQVPSSGAVRTPKEEEHLSLGAGGQHCGRLISRDTPTDRGNTRVMPGEGPPRQVLRGGGGTTPHAHRWQTASHIKSAVPRPQSTDRCHRFDPKPSAASSRCKTRARGGQTLTGHAGDRSSEEDGHNQSTPEPGRPAAAQTTVASRVA